MADQHTPAPHNEALEDSAANQDQDGDFEALFDEFSGNRSPDDEGRADKDATSSDNTEGDNPGGGDAGGDDAEGDDDSDAPDEDLTPREQELQAQLEKLRQSEASQRGRVGAYQRQINELKRQQAQQPPQSGGQAGQSPDQSSKNVEARQEADQKQAMAKAAGSEDWNALEQDFPDIARALESRLDEDRQDRARLQQEVAEMRASVQSTQQQAHEQYLGNQQDALQARHSDWKEVVNAPAFQQWLQQQPPSIQTLTESDDAAEAAALLDLFKGANPEAGSDAAQADAQVQRAKRQQRLEGAQVPQRRGAAKRDATPDDWEGQFNHFAKHKR